MPTSDGARVGSVHDHELGLKSIAVLHTRAVPFKAFSELKESRGKHNFNQDDSIKSKLTGRVVCN